jgi:hypothetical protein
LTSLSLRNVSRRRSISTQKEEENRREKEKRKEGVMHLKQRGVGEGIGEAGQ